MSGEHLVPLGDTGWSVWRDAVLRGTGFPIDGLARFTAPDCAKAADAFLAGDADERLFEERFEQALAAGAATCVELAGDPRLREAITWQSTTALVVLDSLRRAGVGGYRKNSTWRQRHRLVAKYWQRYCAKNETIGFFGPCAWITLDPDAPALTARVGEGLIRKRAVDFEYWALNAVAHSLAEDSAVRRWLPPALAPHLTLTERQVLRPALPPVPVSTVDAEVLRRCDGRQPAVAIVEALVADGVVRGEDDGYLLLDRLAERELLTWRGDLPQGPQAESVLRRLLAGIGDAETRARATAAFGRLSNARDKVAEAAGDPEQVGTALAAAGEVFTEITGRSAYRHAGQSYVGRGLCVEDTTRDVDVVLGGRLLAELAEPMALVLQAARWLTAELAQAYRRALRDVYEDLAAQGEVRLSEIWYLAQGLLFGAGERPVDEVTREFSRRWATVFGATSDHVLRLSSADVAAAVHSVFPADRPGWSAGRLHSPDLLLCAQDVAAVDRGDFLVVLGELHTAWQTLDGAFLTRWHPDQPALARALAEDIGGQRILPLYPADWPRYTGRLSHTMDSPTDRQLGFVAAPGADPDRLLPATSVLVRPGPEGEPVAQAPDGQTWPLLEMFSALLSMQAAEAFKVVGDAPHTPRIMVDKLVVARETWRTTVDATGLTVPTGDRDRYLAVRRWQRELGLPDRVFVKLEAEVKPFYADLTSPVYTDLLCVMLRSAGQGRVTVTEVLPDVNQHWLRDAEGRRYSSELRLHMVDPAAAR
ncbi:lantibiotic dehydratase [Kutzneria sp. NPDC052558]|uniref:lantibiotic dehydratase n=1 Tax=Kutzneria sp. NPDC052558 TaxID=3364121 RepID=UPI0037C8E608